MTVFDAVRAQGHSGPGPAIPHELGAQHLGQPLVSFGRGAPLVFVYLSLLSTRIV